MNTFKDAFKVAIEKHLDKKNEDVESGSLHPFTLINMIRSGQKNEKSSLQKYSESPLETQ